MNENPASRAADEAAADLSDFPETSACEIVDPNSTRSIYEEALAESLTSDREAAKGVIAERIKEIQRLEMLLAKAKAELQKLLAKDVTEIAMTETSRKIFVGGPMPHNLPYRI